MKPILSIFGIGGWEIMLLLFTAVSIIIIRLIVRSVSPKRPKGDDDPNVPPIIR